MNRLVFLAVFGLATVAMVSAHRNGGGGDSRSRDRDIFGWLGGLGGFFNRFRRCECSTRSNQCTGNSGTNNFDCSNNRTAYIQCQETVCSVQACPANSLFNCTSRQCQPCPAGFHVDVYQRKCVCDQGTTLNRATQTCTPCPTNAVVTVDSCYCYASVLSRPDNACKACPTGSTMDYSFQCRCNDETKPFKNVTDKPFWSENDFACKQCPGVWVNQTITEQRRGWRTYTYVDQKCQCQGTNEFFNKCQVACVTCPTNSVLVTSRKGYDATCQCNLRTQIYDCKTNTCVDKDADSRC